MYKCYNCQYDKVSWKQDYSPKDFGMEWEGVIQEYKCPKCNALILFEIPNETKAEKKGAD